MAINSVKKYDVVSPQFRTRMLSLSALGTTGVAEVQQITAPAVAGATQADYFVISNFAGQTAAVWLDLNAAGTVPTGAAYVAATFKIPVSVVTGNTAAQVKAAIVTAIGTTLPTITVVSNGTATLSVTSSVDGNVTAPAVHNANDSGAGSFTASTLTAGVTSLVALVAGKFDATIAESGAGPGDYTITFNEPFVQVPQVAVMCVSARAPQIVSATVSVVRVLMNDMSGNPVDSDFHMMVFGSKAVDLIS